MPDSRLATVIKVSGRNRDKLLALPDFVYVGRQFAGFEASIWGNPFWQSPQGIRFDPKRVSLKWHLELDSEEAIRPATCVQLFERWLHTDSGLLAMLPDLRGKQLGCWCGTWRPGQPEIACHAVTLAKLANALEIAST